MTALQGIDDKYLEEAYVLIGIGNEVILKFASKEQSCTVDVTRSATKNTGIHIVLPTAACLMVICSIIFAVVSNTLKNERPKPVYTDDSTVISTEQLSTENINSQLPYRYPNDSNSTSLLLLKPMEIVGEYSNQYYENGNKDKGNKRIRQYLIVKAEIMTDYYNHISEGTEIFIAFRLNYLSEVGDISIDKAGDIMIDPKEFGEVILNLDCFIYYIDDLRNDTLYEGLNGGKVYDELVSFENISFYSPKHDEMIPFVNGITDYRGIQALLDKNRVNRHLEDMFKRICNSNYSISQGCAMDEAIETVKKLIELKLFGGIYEK